jgi:hypothetical protein
MGVGRFICVGMPFALTACSLACILIVMFAGITSNSLFMFSADTKDLSIPLTDLSSLERRANMRLSGSGIVGAITSGGSSLQGSNVTASDLGLFDSYTVSLWNYCYFVGTTKTCMPAKFDWAANSTAFTTNLTNIANANGANFTDATLTNAVKTFGIVVKWTEVVYIIAAVLAVVELIVGLFAFCSRIGSCCTYIVSGFFTTAIIAAAGMSTFTSAIVVGTVKALEKYGVHAAFNISFLAISWLAVAFAIAASLFWLFSICCCAPNHSSRRDRRSRAGGEKVPYGGYERVNDPFLPHHAHQETGYVAPTQPAAAQRYEPYSHAQV